jgi:hypothetical protein
MNPVMRGFLQVVFLLLLVLVLGTWTGGLSVRLGARKRRQCGGRLGSNPSTWPASGMVSELVATPGTDVPTVGFPYSAF